jgi:DNA-binding transcriptional ArsR family regulator
VLLDRADHLRLALSPIRRRLLERLREPASATELAGELALGRQRINYHLRALEVAGLIHLVEERQRRGCVERIMAARAQSFVVDPSVMRGRAGGRQASATVQDRFAAEHLMATVSDVVRDVARMQARAEDEGTRLLTFTIDTEIGFDTPADLERFTTELAAFVAGQAATHGTSGAARRYRIVIGGHPAPTSTAGGSREQSGSRRRRNPRRRTH